MAFLDSSGVTRLWQHIIAKLGNKVDKETGKGLSTNDYTTTEKNKLAGIAEGANNYTLPVASSTLGGVKTTNTDGLDLLTTQGYAPIPIVDGIPYFMPVSVLENDEFHYLTVGNLDLKIYNKGILSLSQGTTNGTIKYTFFNQQVNNVVESDLKIKGLDTAAYHPESYFVPATRTINNKALSANISLTASDVGAAASSHTHSYLPLTGGTLTGSLTVNDDIYGKGTLVSQTNSYPGLRIQNASGANLAMLFSNGANGEYSNIGLRVYSSASTYSIFSFENDGSLNFDGRLYSGNHTIKGDSYPSLIFANAANSKSLAYIQYQTNSGDYGDLQIAVKNSSSGIAYFTFKNSGIFVTPDDIIAKGGVLKSSKNSSPSIALTNASGAWLAYLAAETTDGSYGNAKLRVNKSATEGATFTFGNNGNINVPGTVNLGSALSISSGGTGATSAASALSNLGALPLTGGTLTGNLGVNGIITAKTYLAVERNSNPQLALKNANSNPLAVLYTETSDGSYGNTHLQVYKSATESTTFTFGNTGNFRAYGNIYGSTLQVDGANNWPSLWFKCSSKTNPGVLLQTNELHGFGIYCYGSDLDTATTRYFEGYTFPAPATGLTANKTYTVYSEKNIIYSSSQPTGVKGAIWLKPV